MDYKPFYDQLAKREFAGFMRETARRLLETLVIRVLGMPQGGAFSEFRRIVIQDGSSFAIKDALKEVFPGRFKKVKPAAGAIRRNAKKRLPPFRLTRVAAPRYGHVC